ncbi:MAG: EF-P beta-lysylation protein EpmB [Halioglobus sp.]|nr:EF-P beta-lysylation protein EpmB [Halioglobus sp.]
MSADSLLTSIASDWQAQLRDCFSRGQDLLDFLGLAAQDVGCSDEAASDFPVKVPQSFARRMRRGDPHDPLLLQVLAQPSEQDVVPGYSADPVGESAGVIRHPGVIHKYRGRVLLIVTGGCAVNCRYCFRRHFPYTDNLNKRAGWHEALDYVRADNSIEEVILSGGDPLIATDTHLAQLTADIAEITHVRRLRVHTRVPVVLPDRVTPTLVRALTHPNLQTVMVLHANHANEIDASVADAAGALREANITLLNQAVLLRGVNDSAEALADLSEALFAAGVLPYYLHLLDRVAGAAHFDVPEDEARTLHRSLAAQLPGYLLPKLVREEAGAAGKTLI